MADGVLRYREYNNDGDGRNTVARLEIPCEMKERKARRQDRGKERPRLSRLLLLGRLLRRLRDWRKRVLKRGTTRR